jgi:hypothetical protein
MSDERDTRDESDTDIDHQHHQDLRCHRMTSGVEIDPEIREEGCTPSRYPDRQTLRSEDEESSCDHESRCDEEPSISISTHTGLELGSCGIEEVAISEEMEDTSVEELE